MANHLSFDGAPSPCRGNGAAIDTEAVLRLLAEHRFDEAISLLQAMVATTDSGCLRGLLGTSRFLNEDYAGAVAEFDRALALAPEDPESAEWIRKRDLARANDAAGVSADVPPNEPFDRDALLRLSDEDGANLPETKNPVPPASKLASVYVALGELGGRAIDRIWGLLTPLGHAAHSARAGVWTDWYEKPLYRGLIILSAMREELDEKNLVDTYPAGTRTGFAPAGTTPPPGVRFFRAPDGAWNSLQNPKEGAAGVRFPRNVDRRRTWPEDKPAIDEPNAAEISRALLTRNGPMKEVPFLNLLAAAWIQFMVHDWVSHRTTPLPRGAGPRRAEDALALALPEGHPARALYHQRTMWVGRTMADPTRTPADEGTPPTAINEVTSWWDASQIYGSDVETAMRLRSFVDGKLKLDAKGGLPLGEGGIADTGYKRNWWLGLGLFHTLFVREHNRICEELRVFHPTWGDDRLYGVARLVNAAVMAKIHTIEWTPALLPNPCLSVALGANWYGLLEQCLHRPEHRRVLRRIKLKHPVVGGLLGGKTETYGSPYGLSEEFTEVYRLHELLPDEIALRSFTSGSEHETVSLLATRMKLATEMFARYSMEDLFFSFGNQHPGQIVLNNYPRTLQEISVPGNPVLDVGAVDILRARERGVPRYNEFRRTLNLQGIKRFEDLTNDRAMVEKLRTIYRNDIELIDMQIGTRAESKRPTGFGFGETLFQVFILNASRRLQADRFYTECYDERTYTREGLDWIDRATMKSVLLRHFPALGQTGLANVDNAFEPWDVGELTKERHPLRFLDVAPRWSRTKGDRVRWDS
jgi:hypothetical protein